MLLVQCSALPQTMMRKPVQAREEEFDLLSQLYSTVYTCRTKTGDDGTSLSLTRRRKHNTRLEQQKEILHILVCYPKSSRRTPFLGQTMHIAEPPIICEFSKNYSVTPEQKAQSMRRFVCQIVVPHTLNLVLKARLIVFDPKEIDTPEACNSSLIRFLRVAGTKHFYILVSSIKYQIEVAINPTPSSNYWRQCEMQIIMKERYSTQTLLRIAAIAESLQF
ncbi:MAG: hypothetical protein EZS28_012638 [Streblomastix strix]|uniref:Uncharacterized protein n=1 Tax=Streblomastix strix TaxID=222440 RepID=A0A5J4WA68_9EUKA|nr:MAG: hypothetical protein EZS28_012638 [Streblomastix strix]